MKLSNFAKSNKLLIILREINRKGIDNTRSLHFKEIGPFFRTIRKKCPYWSDYLCFAEVIRRTNRARETIRKNFNKLVDRNDYLKEEKKAVLKYLYSISGSQKQPPVPSEF